jgi:tetratricopeptide (TPR) repeat protein
MACAALAGCVSSDKTHRDFAADRREIEALIQRTDAALRASDADGVLRAFDASDAALVRRKREELQQLAALEDARPSLRLASLSVGTDDAEAAEAAEAIVLEDLTYREHGREKRRAGWTTLRLRHPRTGWEIVAEDDRELARCLDTRLDVVLEPSAARMHGTARIRLEIIAPGEDALLVQLNRGLAITAITDEAGREVAFERTADQVVIPETRALEVGEERTLAIAFDGRLFNESQESGYSQVSLAPAGSFASWVTSWYPHLSSGGSKSTGRITYDVPSGLTVASSGRLAERTEHGPRRTFAFVVDRPLDFSFAAAPYFHREDSVDGIALAIDLLRGGDAKADLYLRECKRVLRCERELYGSYPFDSYAIVEIPSEATGSLGGSSEQGMNLFPVGVLPDDAFPLMLVGHELGHSWWGNLVASGDTAITDEGLAQTTAVLCLNELQGERAMRRFLDIGWPSYPQSARMYFTRFAGDPKLDLPLGVPALGADDGSTLHDLADTKGMCVYSMLRDEIGHDAFVRGLRDVIERFARKAAKIDDFRAAWERASGRDLGAFFEQWMHRSGVPDLALRSTTARDGDVFVTSGAIAQSADPYSVRIEIVLAGAGERHVETIAAAGASTPFEVRTRFEPTIVALDPEHKILRWTGAMRHRAVLADARGLWSAGKPSEARAKLDEFTRLAPDAMSGPYVRGQFHQDSGELELAETAFRAVIARCRALDVEPPVLGACELHLAQVLDLRGERDAALHAYERALALPDEAGSHADAQAGIAAPFRVKAKSPPPDAHTLARFAGQYDNGQGIALRVAIDASGVLTASQPGRPEAPLEWIEGARFRVASANEIVLAFSGEPEVDAVDVTVGPSSFHLQRKK